MNKSLLMDTLHYYFNAKLITNFVMLIMALSSLSLVACTSSATGAKNNDPFESGNRRVHAFNRAVDGAVTKPIAKGYVKIIPDFAKKAVSNFSSNLGTPAIAINQFLQGNVKLGIEDTARFLFNSTFGLGGLIDISTPMGLPKHEEDFGQTLAVWGLGSGPHLSVPFFGPTNPRDGVGAIVDTFMHPLSYLEDDRSRYVTQGLLLADKRASLLDAEELITGDSYLFIRDAYNQRREFLIKDGEVEDTFLDGVEE